MIKLLWNSRTNEPRHVEIIAIIYLDKSTCPLRNLLAKNRICFAYKMFQLYFLSKINGLVDLPVALILMQCTLEFITPT